MAPDYQRIHELEYELGFRDDPPARDLRFGPGVAIPYAWSVEQKRACWESALWESFRRHDARQGCPPKPVT